MALNEQQKQALAVLGERQIDWIPTGIACWLAGCSWRALRRGMEVDHTGYRPLQSVNVGGTILVMLSEVVEWNKRQRKAGRPAREPVIVVQD